METSSRVRGRRVSFPRERKSRHRRCQDRGGQKSLLLATRAAPSPLQHTRGHPPVCRLHHWRSTSRRKGATQQTVVAVLHASSSAVTQRRCGRDRYCGRSFTEPGRDALQCRPTEPHKFDRNQPPQLQTIHPPSSRPAAPLNASLNSASRRRRRRPSQRHTQV